MIEVTYIGELESGRLVCLGFEFAFVRGVPFSVPFEVADKILGSDFEKVKE